MISGIVLAAGESRRFGATKQLVEVRGKPMVLHAVDALREAGVDEIVVVTGHDAEPVEAVLPDDVQVVRNPVYSHGLSASLSAGLHSLHERSEAAVVLMADQPGVSAEDVRALVSSFQETRSRIVRLAFTDGPGPALISREVYAQAAHLHGDTGARVLMASHPGWVEEVKVERRAPRDVDEPSDVDGA